MGKPSLKEFRLLLLGGDRARNGDLIFVREDTEMGQAIQASTGNYSHVAIFWTAPFIMPR